ncbi:SRRTB protein, partial [Atractosteus spatula]|nr:SRRTB protein [Atractosteus spatula]
MRWGEIRASQYIVALSSGAEMERLRRETSLTQKRPSRSRSVAVRSTPGFTRCRSLAFKLPLASTSELSRLSACREAQAVPSSASTRPALGSREHPPLKSRYYWEAPTLSFRRNLDCNQEELGIMHAWVPETESLCSERVRESVRRSSDSNLDRVLGDPGAGRAVVPPAGSWAGPTDGTRGGSDLAWGGVWWCRFRSKYHPDEVGRRKAEAHSALQNRLGVFMYLLENGWLDNISLDIDRAPAIIKILDAAVIKMEGGGENDLRILEQPTEEEEERGGGGGAAEPAKREEARGGDSERKPPADKEDKEKKGDSGGGSGEEKLKKGGEEEQGEKSSAKEESEPKKLSKKRKRKRSGDSEDEPSASDSDSDSESGSEKPARDEEREDEEEDEEKEEGESDGDESDGDECECEDLSVFQIFSVVVKERKEEKLKDREKEREREREEKKVKEKEVEIPPPRPLHKTCSLFMRSIAPTISKAEIVALQLCRRYPGFMRVALSEPQPERRCFSFQVLGLSNSPSVSVLTPLSLSAVLMYCSVQLAKVSVCRAVTHCAERRQAGQGQCVLCCNTLQRDDRLAKVRVCRAVTHCAERRQAGQGQCVSCCNALCRETTGWPSFTCFAPWIHALSSIMQVLDRLLLYLRIVHSIDYYNTCEYPSEDEMPNRCGIIHVRGPIPPNRITHGEVAEWQKTFEEKLTPLFNVRESLSEEEAVKMGRKVPEQEVEKFVSANTQELGKDKWLCPLSGKKFKGPEFVRKHIFNKHGEKIEEVKKEVLFFNNFLMDAKRPSLPEIKAPPPPGPGQGVLSPGLPYPHQSPQGLMGYGQPRPPVLGYGGGGPPYPPNQYGGGRGNYDSFRGQGGYPGKPRNNRMIRGDPRAIIEYRDLDAPDDVDFF